MQICENKCYIWFGNIINKHSKADWILVGVESWFGCGEVSGYFMTTFKLTNFNVLLSGTDGGHHYISSVIVHNRVKRQLTALFKKKSYEKELSGKLEITVRGNLLDEGLQQSLMLLDTEIIERQ